MTQRPTMKRKPGMGSASGETPSGGEYEIPPGIPPSRDALVGHSWITGNSVENHFLRILIQ
jgi:hypothetical protein